MTKENFPAIQTYSLSKRYKNITALDQLDLKVPRGSIFGFLGPNGAGKTTTIRLLLGLTFPTGGTASIFNMDAGKNASEVRKITGALLENPGLYERLNALDNLKYYADIYNLPSEVFRKRMEKLLKMFEIWDRRKEKPAQWSRGMKQRLALSRALLHKPRLLFLDEPTLGLDVASGRRIRRILTWLADEEDCTIFLTSHNLNEVEEICSRIAIINEGKKVADASPEDLKSGTGEKEIFVSGSGIVLSLLEEIEHIPDCRIVHPQEYRSSTHKEWSHITLRIPSQTPVDSVIKTIAKHGAIISDIQTRTHSLENIFLKLTNAETNERDEDSDD